MADPNKITGQRLQGMLNQRIQRSENLRKTNILIRGGGSTSDNIYFEIEIGNYWGNEGFFTLRYRTSYAYLKDLDECKVNDILDRLEEFVNVFVTGEGYESFVRRYASRTED